MMDFFVRETRAVVEGPIAIVRFGTCGGLSPDAIPGTVVCAAAGSSFVSRNYDYFDGSSNHSDVGSPYILHKVK
jgi:uridine phosphorylase